MRVTELLTKDTIAMDLMANDKMVLLMSSKSIRQSR